MAGMGKGLYPGLIKTIAVIQLILILSLSVGCAVSGFERKLSTAIQPYRFSIFGWELQTLPLEIKELFSRQEEAIGGSAEVIEYFSLVERIRTRRAELAAVGAGVRQGDASAIEEEIADLIRRQQARAPEVAAIISRQIREVLSRQGIYHPLDSYLGVKMGFPPVNFVLERPPNLLVVSPRSRIETIRTITLAQNITASEMAGIESEVDELGVSSLVVALGGLGATFPAFVSADSSLPFTIDTVIEEWLHQYLAFRFLGARYVMHLTGFARDYEIAIMNETLAGIVSQELGDSVLERYYPGYENSQGAKSADIGFDFNREMREIRREVDRLLAGGEVSRAEEFMEERRQFLAGQGYHLRKLNQAYFAFHGAYAYRPTSVEPIGQELRELRGRYDSLKDFLNAVAGMNSRQDLKLALEKEGVE